MTRNLSGFIVRRYFGSSGPQKGGSRLSSSTQTHTTTEPTTTAEVNTEAATTAAETTTEEITTTAQDTTPEISQQKDNDEERVIHDHTVVAESTTAIPMPMPMTESPNPERKRNKTVLSKPNTVQIVLLNSKHGLLTRDLIT